MSFTSSKKLLQQHKKQKLKKFQIFFVIDIMYINKLITRSIIKFGTKKIMAQSEKTQKPHWLTHGLLLLKLLLTGASQNLRNLF